MLLRGIARSTLTRLSIDSTAVVIVAAVVVLAVLAVPGEVVSPSPLHQGERSEADTHDELVCLLFAAGVQGGPGSIAIADKERMLATVKRDLMPAGCGSRPI
jgi:hypothetical protein